MTDYLEELLPQEDVEEREMNLALGAKVVSRTVEAGEQEQDGPEAGTVPFVEDVSREATAAEVLWPELAVPGRRDVLRLGTAAGRTGAVETVEAGAAVELAGLVSGEEGARNGGAADLLERLTRARQVVRQLDGSGGTGSTVVTQVEQGRDGGLGLDALDRAVQRDARRYDSGFTLF